MISRALLLFAGVAPVIAVTVAYMLGVYEGVLPRCLPFIDGCTSISATGRYTPGSYVFKPLFLLQSGLLLWIWFSLARYFRVSAAGQPVRVAKTIEIAALIASVALVVYTLTLGSNIPLYEFMRRFGIYFYFIGTVACQIAATLALRRLVHGRPLAVRAMIALVAAPFVLGFVNFYLKATINDADSWENRIEWCAALLMQAWFVCLYAVTGSLRESPFAR
jgi:hypothetical protein